MNVTHVTTFQRHNGLLSYYFPIINAPAANRKVLVFMAGMVWSIVGLALMTATAGYCNYIMAVGGPLVGLGILFCLCAAKKLRNNKITSCPHFIHMNISRIFA